MKLLGSFRRSRPEPVRVGSLLILYGLIAVFLVGCAMLVAAAMGAQDRSIPSPDRIELISGRPVIDLNGTLVSFPLTARFVTVDAKPSGEITATVIGSVEVDLMKSNGSVVVDGIAVDDREAADHLMAIMTREWRKANPGPLPVRRRALRGQP